MSDIQKYQAAAVGSLHDQAVATGKSVEELMAEVETVILMDRSGSMADPIYDSERRSYSSRVTKHDKAKEAVSQLQRDYPGKILIIAFDNVPEAVLDGNLPEPRGGTDMAPALEMALPFDETCSTIMVSDGLPNDEEETMRVARRFTKPINCIYIGPKGDRGEQFMNRLAGGLASTQVEPKMLKAAIAGFLPAAGGTTLNL